LTTNNRLFDEPKQQKVRPTMADDQNQGNQQGGGQGGQKQKQGPPKIFCEFCRTEAPQGAVHCVNGNCGKALKVPCPNTNCGVHVVNRPNGACDKCGTPLVAKPATPAKPKLPVFELSVNVSGKAGKYTLAIQVLKDGEPAKNQAIIVWDGESHSTTTDAQGKTITLQTNENGFLSWDVNFTCNEVHATVTVVGTNKFWTQKLVGAGFKPTGGFWTSLLASMKYYRGQ
jgi:hypothetical protein